MMIKKVRAIETKKYFCPHCQKQIDLDTKSIENTEQIIRKPRTSKKVVYAQSYYMRNREKILAQQKILREKKEKEKTGWLSGV